MEIFFDNPESLHQFTLELDHHQQSISCLHCDQHGQLVSHGFIYKKLSHGLKQTVGKRVLCSDRSSRSGCGRTQRLYLTSQTPQLQYSSDHLYAFLCALLAGVSVHNAYTQTTKSTDSRHAYRWLDKFERKLTDYRCAIMDLSKCVQPVPQGRSRRMRLLLSTFRQLFSCFSPSPLTGCQHYQLLFQKAFI